MFNVGRAIGAGLGGFLYEELGLRLTFRTSGIGAFVYVAFLIIVLLVKCFRKKSVKSGKKTNGGKY